MFRGFPPGIPFEPRKRGGYLEKKHGPDACVDFPLLVFIGFYHHWPYLLYCVPGDEQANFDVL